MKVILLFICILFVVQPVSAQIRIVDDCNLPISASSVFDRLSRNIDEIQEKFNKCDQVPKSDRKVKGEKEASTAKVLLEMAGGCFVGLIKGFIHGLKDIITSFWDLTKLGWKLAKKFGKQMVNYLYLAYKGGISTLFSEYARDTQDFLQTILNGLKAIPQMILEAGVKQVETFKCLNTQAKANYVCKTMSYIGTDVLLAVLTGGASKIGYISKVNKAIQLGARAHKAKLLKKAAPLLKGRVAQSFLKRSFQGFNSKKAGRVIDRLDKEAFAYKRKLDKTTDELDLLVKKFADIPTGPVKTAYKRKVKAKADQLKLVTKKMNEHNTALSHLRTKKLIHDLDKEGAIEITKVIPDGKSLNDLDLAKGRYPPWSEGGPVYEIKVKKRVELCRGGAFGEAAKGAGRWFLPCKKDNYRSKAENQWVNATADNPYDEFAKYNLREGDTIQIGGINPITNNFGKKRVFRDQKSGRQSVVRGGGGEVQVFRPSRDKLTTEDLVRTAKVYNDPDIRKLQAQLERIGDRKEALKIKKKISKRVDDDEASSFLIDIQNKILGLPELPGQK